MRKLFTNISGLVQAREKEISFVKGSEMKDLPILNDAYLLVENGMIADYGKMEDLEHHADQTADLSGRFVFPGWCDSHTHIVYAQSREEEFVYRLKGMSYEEIAEKGGGILNSARRLQECPEDQLYEDAMQRVQEMAGFGTAAIEIKSGYGLSYEAELKMLRVIRRIKENSPLTIRSTFLGAHAFPMEFRENREAYMKILLNELLPKISDEGLADYIDVFCDRGFFTVEETTQILEAGEKYGLQAKIHANELDYSGGVQVGVKHKALSVDHLECVGDEEIKSLLNSQTMPTLLPGTAFFLNLEYAPARKMIDAGLPIALATDYNPGSTPSGNMPFVLSLACLKMKMLPEEAVNAVTINSAYAMGLSKTHGRIFKNGPANFCITNPMRNLSFLMYAYGSSVIDNLYINGNEVS